MSDPLRRASAALSVSLASSLVAVMVVTFTIRPFWWMWAWWAALVVVTAAVIVKARRIG